jgi:hypothetical protein
MMTSVETLYFWVCGELVVPKYQVQIKESSSSEQHILFSLVISYVFFAPYYLHHCCNAVVYVGDTLGIVGSLGAL